MIVQNAETEWERPCEDLAPWSHFIYLFICLLGGVSGQVAVELGVALHVLGWPQQATKHVPSCSLVPPPAEGIRRAKGRKPRGCNTDTLTSEGKREKQVMRRQSVTHLPWWVPSQSLSSSRFGKTAPQLVWLSMVLCGMEEPLGQFGSVVLTLSPPSLLPTPVYLLGLQSEKWRTPWGTAV